jgi:hypothetical protein
MRVIAKIATSVLMVSSVSFASTNLESSEPQEKCFPWNADIKYQQSAELNLEAELCYLVPTDKTGVQKIWGSKVSTEADAQGRLYENQLKLGHWMGGIKLSNEGTANIYGEVMVAGQEVLNKDILLEEVAVERNFQLLGYEQNVAKRIMIGVIPATISLGVLTDGHVDLNAEVMKSNVGMGALPVINANSYAKAGFGNDVVFIGFSGAVELVNEELDFSSNIYAPKKGEKIKLTLTGKNKVKALTGAIDATVNVKGNKYVKNISTFNGVERVDTIVDKTIDVN